VVQNSQEQGSQPQAFCVTPGDSSLPLGDAGVLGYSPLTNLRVLGASAGCDPPLTAPVQDLQTSFLEVQSIASTWRVGLSNLKSGYRERAVNHWESDDKALQVTMVALPRNQIEKGPHAGPFSFWW
jgi:hypothetical protein